MVSKRELHCTERCQSGCDNEVFMNPGRLLVCATCKPVHDTQVRDGKHHKMGFPVVELLIPYYNSVFSANLYTILNTL